MPYNFCQMLPRSFFGLFNGRREGFAETPLFRGKCNQLWYVTFRVNHNHQNDLVVQTGPRIKEMSALANLNRSLPRYVTFTRRLGSNLIK